MRPSRICREGPGMNGDCPVLEGREVGPPFWFLLIFSMLEHLFSRRTTATSSLCGCVCVWGGGIFVDLIHD